MVLLACLLVYVLTLLQAAQLFLLHLYSGTYPVDIMGVAADGALPSPRRGFRPVPQQQLQDAPAPAAQYSGNQHTNYDAPPSYDAYR